MNTVVSARCLIKLQSYGDNVLKMVRKQLPTNSKLKVNLKRFNWALPRWTVGADGEEVEEGHVHREEEDA